MMRKAAFSRFLQRLASGYFDKDTNALHAVMMPVARFHIWAMVLVTILLSFARLIGIAAGLPITGEERVTASAEMENSLTIVHHTPTESVIPFHVATATIPVFIGALVMWMTLHPALKTRYGALFICILYSLYAAFSVVLGFRNNWASRMDNVALVAGWISTTIFMPSTKFSAAACAGAWIVLQAISTLTNGNYVSLVTIFLICGLNFALHRRVKAFFVGYLSVQEKQKEAYEGSLEVLCDLLPTSTATSLLEDPDSVSGIAVQSSPVLLFSDVVGFTALSSKLGALRTFEALHRMQDTFDNLSLYWEAEKLETVGDATEFRWPSQSTRAVGELGTVSRETAASGAVTRAFTNSKRFAKQTSKYLEKDLLASTSKSHTLRNSSTTLASSELPPPGSFAEMTPIIATSPALADDTSFMDASSVDVSKAVGLGLDLILATKTLSSQLVKAFVKRGMTDLSEDTVKIRCGIAVGEVVSGCIGKARPQYSLIGPGTATALLVEEHGNSMELHLNGAAASLWITRSPHLNGELFVACTAAHCKTAALGMDCGHVRLSNELLSASRRKRIMAATTMGNSKHIGILKGMVKAASKAQKASRSPAGSRKGLATVSSVASSTAPPDSIQTATIHTAGTNFTSSSTVGSRNLPNLAENHGWWTWGHFKALFAYPEPEATIGHTKAEIILQIAYLKIYAVVLVLAVSGSLFAIYLGQKSEGLMPSPFWSIVASSSVFFCMTPAVYYARRFQNAKAFLLLVLYITIVNLGTRSLTFAKYIGDSNAPTEYYYSPLIQGLLYNGTIGMLVAPPMTTVYFMVGEFFIILIFTIFMSNQQILLSAVVISIGLRCVYVLGALQFYKLRTKWAAVFDDTDRQQQLLTGILLRLMPAETFEKLVANPRAFIAETHGDCSVMFFQLISLDDWITAYGGVKAFQMINDLFLELDDLAIEHGCRPIESVRNEWLVACGAPEEDRDHVSKILTLATCIRRACKRRAAVEGIAHDFKVGVQCGPVTVGPLGALKRAFKYTGDTVNTASRFKSTSPTNRVHVSAEVADRATILGHSFDDNGTIPMKGKGEMRGFILS